MTPKGKHVLAQMRKTYGSEEQAKRVLYASANAGKLRGVHKRKPASVAK